MADFIDKEHLISILIGKMKYESDLGVCEGLRFAIDKARELPAVAAVRNGYWALGYHEFGTSWHCSECDFIVDIKRNFCACCGAKMDGGAENEN